MDDDIWAILKCQKTSHVSDSCFLTSRVDQEVRRSNTEESVINFIRRKYNSLWAPSLIFPYI